MKIVDADKVREKLVEGFSGAFMPIVCTAIDDVISEMETVDAVEVIRCRDCDSWDTWDKNGNQCSCAYFTNDKNVVCTEPDFFCAHGEKR